MKKYEKFFFILGIVLCASEIGKQLLLTFSVNDGIYDWWYFPFQLCSLPMYLMTALPLLKSDGAKRIVLTFLMTFSLLGGIAVFFDTSGMHYPLPILTVHSYLWHILLIVTGICSGLFCLRFPAQGLKNGLLPWRTFFYTVLLYGFFCLTASVVNLIVTPAADINMFYINPAYPMEQVFFRQFSRLAGNTAGIAAYILATVSGSALLFTFWRTLGRKFAHR